MNIDEVRETVEESLLSRQLNSLERLILCQSWLGRGYSEMAVDCAYSIAHIKDIGSQLWQALSKALGERVTKKNLFLVLKQYPFSRTGETVNRDQLQVTFSWGEVIETPLMPTPNQLLIATYFVEASYSGDSEQLSRICDHNELVTQESSQLERVQQQCPISTDNKDIKKQLLGVIDRYERSTVMTARPLWAIAKRCQMGWFYSPPDKSSYFSYLIYWKIRISIFDKGLQHFRNTVFYFK